MGGDSAPDCVLDGIDLALAADSDVHILLTGAAKVVELFAASRDRVEAVPTTEVIGTQEHPAAAVRAKRDSSIVVGCRLVRERRADAFFSAGSTGACMAAALLGMGRLPGVSRPAIATIIPTAGTPVVLLDVGANADCKPENLVQFAHMGAAYASAVLGTKSPRVALLNIGEEPTKGSQLALDAHALMAGQVPGFIGNVEGRDLSGGAADVIVTDGFTGNVALKLLEGTSRTLLDQVRAAMTSGIVNTLAAAVLRPSLARLKARLDPEVYGGAPLLGVDGVCIIGHGSSGPRAVSSAIGVGSLAVRARLTDMIGEAIASS
jgi:glycerol-3-phosphate acyltransferase PlsX